MLPLFLNFHSSFGFIMSPSDVRLVLAIRGGLMVGKVSDSNVMECRTGVRLGRRIFILPWRCVYRVPDNDVALMELVFDG